MTATPGREKSLRQIRTTPTHLVRPWPLPRAHSEVIELLRADLAEADNDQERTAILQAFQELIQQRGTPLVESEDADWCRFTFIWMGTAPHGVVLQLNRIADTRDVQDTLLERIGDTEVHALTLRLPSIWQGSYLFAPLPEPVAPNLHDPIDMGTMGLIAQAAETDPFARERMPSKATVASASRTLPEYAVARGSAAPRTALWADDPLPPAHTFTVRSPANAQALQLHHWAAPDTQADSPVILLLDGEVWRKQFPVAPEISRRSSEGLFPAAHLLFLESGGPMQRELDYAGTVEQTGELLESIAEAVSGVVPDSGWILAGQSFGGLFAALCAHRHPERVHAALAQSPSFWWPAPLHPWEPRTQSWFEERARVNFGAPLLLQAGAVDAGVVERSRDAAALLRSQSALIDYQEHPGGHDVLQWQSDLVDGLAHILSLTV